MAPTSVSARTAVRPPAHDPGQQTRRQQASHGVQNARGTWCARQQDQHQEDVQRAARPVGDRRPPRQRQVLAGYGGAERVGR
ncbi:hypothetical protein ACQ4WX_46685 [Streptomyces lasalocidi]